MADDKQPTRKIPCNSAFFVELAKELEVLAEQFRGIARDVEPKGTVLVDGGTNLELGKTLLKRFRANALRAIS